jgi:hypothetical protein
VIVGCFSGQVVPACDALLRGLLRLSGWLQVHSALA